MNHPTALLPQPSNEDDLGEFSDSPAVLDDLQALRQVLEGTAVGTGEEFFQALVRHLARAIEVSYAVVADFAEVPSRVRTLAFWARDRIVSNFEYDIVDTPCAELVRGGMVHYPTGVARKFPRAAPLTRLGIDSYLAVPFLDASGKILGHLAVFDDRPMPAEPQRLFIFRIFAARAAAERERLRTEQRLRESESRYRDLYENAPNAYLSIGTDGMVRQANRRAAEWLGYAAEELVGSSILSYTADGLTGKARANEVLRRLCVGEGVPGWEIEMRRKDGRPLWVSLWMEPVFDAAGKVQASRSFWVDITDRVLAEKAQARLVEQNLYLREEIRAEHHGQQIIGKSPAVLEVLDKIKRVAAMDTSVLITGETGTGKEMVARAIHAGSKRKDQPLIKVNCAALPAGLVESELFGHEKGAFSGAIARRTGRFELADGGTIFLDEVGELPPEAQGKLLRVLQEREFDRVGGTSPIRVDVRVIAATNRDLKRSVLDKGFREDLYYRLDVFPIHVAPLRERHEDIPLLVDFLVARFTARTGKTVASISPRTLQHFLEYSWPGNVRELENVLERAVILMPGTMLEIAPNFLPVGSVAITAQAGTLEAVEREHILTVLHQAAWVIEGSHGAARLLGLHANTLRNRMKKLGIFRPAPPN
jgi:PAS domain S-box-containing protein